ncbi:MAG: hypothetical protein ACTHLW_17615 [Verrucomicrobiota bacterium]
MKKLLTILVLLTVTFASSTEAALAIYRQKQTTTISGGGMVEKEKLSGYLVLDADTADVLFVNVDSKRGTFRMDYPTNYVVQNVSTGLNKESLAMIFPNSDGGSLALKGKNVTLDLFVSELYYLPKVMSVSGSAVTPVGDTFYIEEYRGTYSFSSGDTYDANTFNDTLAEAEETVRQSLLDWGYVEVFE